jgi:hypothetical protein
MSKGQTEEGTITMKIKHFIVKYWSPLPSHEAEKSFKTIFFFLDSWIGDGW